MELRMLMAEQHTEEIIRGALIEQFTTAQTNILLTPGQNQRIGQTKTLLKL